MDPIHVGLVFDCRNDEGGDLGNVDDDFAVHCYGEEVEFDTAAAVAAAIHWTDRDVCDHCFHGMTTTMMMKRHDYDDDADCDDEYYDHDFRVAVVAVYRLARSDLLSAAKAVVRKNQYTDFP